MGVGGRLNPGGVVVGDRFATPAKVLDGLPCVMFQTKALPEDFVLPVAIDGVLVVVIVVRVLVWVPTLTDDGLNLRLRIRDGLLALSRKLAALCCSAQILALVLRPPILRYKRRQLRI